MDIPFEEYLPNILSKLYPETLQEPAGQNLIQEALYNTALPYDARTSLFVQGEKQRAADIEQRRLWGMGQGALAGGLAAVAVVKGLRGADGLARALDNARHQRIVQDLDSGVRALPAGSVNGVFGNITSKTLSHTGMEPTGLLGSRLVPTRTMSLGELLRGPLMAREGNMDAAVRDLGRIVEDAASGAGFTAAKNPLLGRAIRSAQRRHSLWDQLSHKGAGFLRTTSRAGLHPLSRALLAAAAMGGGAYLGQRDVEDDPTLLTPDQALRMLQQRDRARALSHSTHPPAEVTRRLGMVNNLVSPLATGQHHETADLLESVLGEPILAFDTVAQEIDPSLAQTWETIAR